MLRRRTATRGEPCGLHPRALSGLHSRRLRTTGKLGSVPRLTTLLATFVVGVALFVLFAFTFVGLVGETIIVASLLGFIARTASAGHCRRQHR
jgi:hypothetical protein